MQVTFQCPVCEATSRNEVTAEVHSLKCGWCQWQRDIPNAHLDGDRPLKCQYCGNPDLWRQKDFPQGLGILMAGTGATLSVIAWAYYRPLLALGILLIFAAIDMALFVFMPDVLVCYRCRARHRTPEMADDHPRFDLELAERYRQEEKRLAEAQPKTPDA